MTNTPNIRKTFAIISHPDAGKTTLTEKLLLFGGAIQQAGAVKARGENRHAHSDWMKVEQERGISVASSVMNFEYNNITFNLLDTPGHEDFSEDTYRVLTAVDSAVMVLDSAKGIETQTKKLFEVCRLRDVPILTFINKLDREGQDPFALLDEIEKTLALDVTPASWPIGMGKDFLGCYDILNDQLILMNKTGSKSQINSTIETCRGLEDEKLDRLLPAHMVAKLREDVEMIKELCPKFDLDAYLCGSMTPVFFGSAINNFGVREVLEGLCAMAPAPRPHPAVERLVAPEENKVSGFIFKIQANMDPKHRPFQTGNEAGANKNRQGNKSADPGYVFGSRARVGRGRLCRRHHRYSQPRTAAYRRYPDRRRKNHLYRDSEFCSGTVEIRPCA